MKPVMTDETNGIFIHEDFPDLPGTRCHDPETGKDYVETCWEMSPEELKRVQETGRVYILVVGHDVQPMTVSTESMIIA